MKYFIRIHRPRIYALKGSFAWELQLGSLIIQVPYRKTRDWPCWRGHRVHVWRLP